MLAVVFFIIILDAPARAFKNLIKISLLCQSGNLGLTINPYYTMSVFLYSEKTKLNYKAESKLFETTNSKSSILLNLQTCQNQIFKPCQVYHFLRKQNRNYYKHYFLFTPI